MSRGISTKPPNVLVLCGAQKGEGSQQNKSFFSAVRECLISSLDSQRYVVYPLPLEDAGRVPWRDNCRLLVVPSGLQLPDGPEVLDRELESYVKNGGTLLSTHATTNAAFGFQLPENFQRSRLVEIAGATPQIQPNEWIVARICAPRVENLPDVLSTLPQQKTSRALARMREVSLSVTGPCKNGTTERGEGTEGKEGGGDVNGGGDGGRGGEVNWGGSGERGGGENVETSVVVDCIQQLQFEGSSGRVVLSHVDLLSTPSSEDSTTSISQLVALKKDAQKVSSLFQSVLKVIGMECSKGESVTPTLSYLVCSDQLRAQFHSVMAPLVKEGVVKGNGVDIELMTSDPAIEGSSVDPPPTPASNKIVLLTRPLQGDLEELGFDIAQYKRLLHTGHMGRTLLYTPVIGSTQTMLTGNLVFTRALRPEMGVVSVAGQQTQGRGRHDNAWLSPEGCMMFSCPLSLRPRSRLLAHLSLLQHIVALSVVTAIRTAPGYEELPVCIKWPNDIYYQNRVKLGGVLASVFSASDPISPTTAVIGCGVNVSNKYPTMSVNDCIQLHNNTTHSSSSSSTRGSSGGGGIILPPFTMEALLALSLNRLERYLSLYEHSGMSAIEADYYHYWLHRDAVVQLGSRGNEEVTVRGIDQFGYLRVVTQTGEELNLRPDGNSFDIMNNLIVMK